MTHQPDALGVPLTVVGRHPDCLPQIFRDEVNLVIWERPPQPAWQSFVQAFSDEAGELERFVTLSHSDSALEVLPRWASDLEGVNAWVRDVDELLEMYHCLFEPVAVGLRLHVLRGTMCPRFHVDRVPVRLLCTYRGVGTEWLPESAVTRPGEEGPLPVQQIAPEQIRQLATGDVALLKGEAWAGNEGRGLVHRSPAPADEPRLVIGIDWLSNCFNS